MSKAHASDSALNLSLILLGEVITEVGRYLQSVPLAERATSVEDVEWEAEEWLARQIREIFGDVVILSEEYFHRYGSVRAGDGDLLISLDPLDGSASYASGSAEYAISVGIRQATRVLAGIVHAPEIGQTFVASRGVAMLNGQALSSDLRLSSPKVAFKSADQKSEMGSAYSNLLRSNGYRVSTIGCTSLQLCRVAEREIAAVVKTVRVSSGLALDWGTLGGLAVCRAARCVVRTWSGRERPWAGPGRIVVRNQFLPSLPTT